MATSDLIPDSIKELIPGTSSKMKLLDAFYKSLEGKQAMEEWMTKMRSRLSEDADEMWVKTRFGPTFITVDGPKDGEPLLAFHGWGHNGMVYVITDAFKGITKSFRTYTIDVIGQAGRSALQTPPIRSSGYADWIQDIMDELKIEKAHFLGTSFGGWLVLRYGCEHPEAVMRATLLCPAGLARPRMDPSILYYFYKTAYFPSRKNSTQFVKKVILSPNSNLSGPILEDIVDLFQLSISHFQTNAELPYTLDEELLKKFSAPTLLLIGKDDLLFPAEQVMERGKKVLPNLNHAEILPDTGHALEDFDYLDYVLPEHFLGNSVKPSSEFKAEQG